MGNYEKVFWERRHVNYIQLQRRVGFEHVEMSDKTNRLELLPPRLQACHALHPILPLKGREGRMRLGTLRPTNDSAMMEQPSVRGKVLEVHSRKPLSSLYHALSEKLRIRKEQDPQETLMSGRKPKHDATLLYFSPARICIFSLSTQVTPGPAPFPSNAEGSVSKFLYETGCTIRDAGAFRNEDAKTPGENHVCLWTVMPKYDWKTKRKNTHCKVRILQRQLEDVWEF
nr:uncharacterized protein LOC129471017 isoform X1 [Symphalangus syndactylus]